MAGGRLADKAVIVAAGSAVESLGTVIVSMALARLLASDAELGTYKQVWLIPQTFIPLFLLGTTHAVYFFLPGLAQNGHQRFMLRSYGLLTGSGIVLSILILIFADAIANGFSNPSLVPILKAFCLYPLFVVPAMLTFPFLISTQRHVRATIANLAFFTLQSIVIVSAIGLGTGLERMFAWLIPLAALRYAYGLFEIIRVTREQRHESTPEKGTALFDQVKMRKVLDYSIPVGLSSLATVLGQKADRFVVSGALSASRFGVYSLGAVEFPGISLITMATNTVLRPRLAALFHEGRSGELVSFWRESFRKQSLLLPAMAIFLGIYAEEVVTVLYTERFIGAAPVLRIYLVVALLRQANYGVVLSSIGETRPILWGTIAFLALNLGLSILLVEPFEILGPPIATVVSLFALSLYYSILAASRIGVEWRSLVPAGVYLRATVVAVGAGAVAISLKRLPVGDLALLAIAGSAFAVAYAVLGVLFRIIRPEDRELAARWLTLRALR